jgi:F0F1-type ATP synthase beta subunit
MEVVDTTQINSFLPEQRADFVSPSEESVFVLTSSQLSALITQAVEKAIQPLQDEVMQLKATVARQGEKIAALEFMQDTQAENSLIQLRLIGQLREAAKKEPGKTEISRAEKIERYLSSRPDHRATFETLKGHLGIDNVLLNQTIKTLMECTPGRYGIARTLGDKRKRTLVMLPK